MENEENKTVTTKPGRRTSSFNKAVHLGGSEPFVIKEEVPEPAVATETAQETFIDEAENTGTVQQIYDRMTLTVKQEKLKNKEIEKEVKDNYSTRLTERQKTMLEQISGALHKETASDVLGTLIEHFHTRNRQEIKKAILKKLKL